MAWALMFIVVAEDYGMQNIHAKRNTRIRNNDLHRHRLSTLQSPSRRRHSSENSPVPEPIPSKTGSIKTLQQDHPDRTEASTGSR